MQVLKFGGSSVANAKHINLCINVIKKKIVEDRIIVVVSAFKGVTDLLLQAGQAAVTNEARYKELLNNIEILHFSVIKELFPIHKQSGILSFVKMTINELEDICSGIFILGELSDKTKDRLAGYGEWLSSQIIVAKLQLDGLAFKWKDSKELLVTDEQFTKADVDYIVSNQKIKSFFVGDNYHYVLPGFIAATLQGIPTTLGRGGSDLTAAMFAACLNAERLEIWTDVNGMMTADPRLTKNAKTIEVISYQEAMELSHFGAKVIYPPTVQPVLKKIFLFGLRILLNRSRMVP